MRDTYLFEIVQRQEWWPHLRALQERLEVGEADAVEYSYTRLLRSLVRAGHPSLAHAITAALLVGDELLARQSGPLPSGMRTAAQADLDLLARLSCADLKAPTERLLGRELPPLEGLATPSPDCHEWLQRLQGLESASLLDLLLDRYRKLGVGMQARYRAFRWHAGKLEGIANPARDELSDLVGVEHQLARLTENIERFLTGRPALDTLLYGPRGSGKSTAVRGLLQSYGERGLRLVEIAPEALPELPLLIEELSRSPLRFVAFVDDLSFERGDAGQRPLKSLLEGTVRERPANLLVVATSNRRHLVREGFSDRPMPEDDDIHAWDTANERLALSDRFGLVITFPSVEQREYLELVRTLAQRAGLEMSEELEREALLFAQWGNGISGRTARHFIDSRSEGSRTGVALG